jgi:hypothetical protein
VRACVSSGLDPQLPCSHTHGVVRHPHGQCCDKIWQLHALRQYKQFPKPLSPSANTARRYCCRARCSTVLCSGWTLPPCLIACLRSQSFAGSPASQAVCPPPQPSSSLSLSTTCAINTATALARLPFPASGFAPVPCLASQAASRDNITRAVARSALPICFAETSKSSWKVIAGILSVHLRQAAVTYACGLVPGLVRTWRADGPGSPSLSKRPIAEELASLRALYLTAALVPATPTKIARIFRRAGASNRVPTIISLSQILAPWPTELVACPAASHMSRAISRHQAFQQRHTRSLHPPEENRSTNSSAD